MNWDYLLTEPFSGRNALAAYYVRDCAQIVEIGSYKNPITNFLYTSHDTIWCVDPLLKRSTKGSSVLFIKKPFQDVDFSPIQDGFGLVTLGLDIGIEHADAFIALLQRSRVAVLESWQTWPPYVNMLRRILERTNKKVVTTIEFDFSNSEVPAQIDGSFPTRYNREMVVLR